MRKTFLISAFIIASSITESNAQNVTILDANFKAYLVGNTAINTNLDTEIQLLEANTYNGAIVCPSLGITDLTGIEEFYALTDLRCQSNLLTSINLSMNTALTALFCQGNLLTSLNLSTNTALQYVYCNGNQLTSLNLNTNTALDNLFCQGNMLTSLNLNNNISLTVLICSGNQLTSLSLKNGNNVNMPNSNFDAWTNPNLTCIEVDDSTYSATNWTNIDVTASFSTDCNLATGIANNSSIPFVNIYPNPTNGTIFLSNCFNVILKDITGKVVFEKQNTTSVDISNQSTGMYFIMLTDNNGRVVQRNKIVKE